jgi:hypothetical protein
MNFKHAVEMNLLTELIVTGDLVGGIDGLHDGENVGLTLGLRGVRISRRTFCEGDAAGSDSDEILMEEAPDPDLEDFDCAAAQAAFGTHEHINLSSWAGSVQLHGSFFWQ